MRRRLAMLPFLFALAACGAGKSGAGGATMATQADAADTSGALEAGGDDADFQIDGATDALPGGLPAAIYAHSSTTLYQLDPNTRAVTKIGDFVDTSGNAITEMTDIALDMADTMYGVTYSDLYRIDFSKPKPVCTHLATLSQSFNGLTFIPAGMIENDEVLIGIASSGDWYRIDVAAGATSATLTKLGSYGGGYTSAGDAVGIIGANVYATVNAPSGGNNHVVVVDPKTGHVVHDLGDCGAGDLWGVGYWAGVLYGFSSTGELYSIDLGTGKGTKVPITNAPTEWWGAGVRTSAPIVQ